MSLIIATSFIVESIIVISYSEIVIVKSWAAPLRGRRSSSCRAIVCEDSACVAAGDSSTCLSVVVRLA